MKFYAVKKAKLLLKDGGIDKIRVLTTDISIFSTYNVIAFYNRMFKKPTFESAQIDKIHIIFLKCV